MLGVFGPKALGVCAALGGIYGASLGAALGSVPPAANVIAATAAILAFVCGVPGVRIGYFYGAVNRVRYGELFLGTFAAIAGAILGGCLATLVLLALGAILCYLRVVRRQRDHGPATGRSETVFGRNRGPCAGDVPWRHPYGR